jgi:hypothetical protein
MLITRKRAKFARTGHPDLCVLVDEQRPGAFERISRF